MSPIVSTNPTIIHTPHENTEASWEAQKAEQHKKKTEKANADIIFKAGSQDAALKNNMQVINFSFPCTTSDKNPNLDAAEKYLNGSEFETVCNLLNQESESTYRINLFSRSFKLFTMILEISKVMRQEANTMSESLSSMKERINTGLISQIKMKGVQACAVGVSSSLMSMGISMAGTAQVLKSSNMARVDMKANHSILPDRHNRIKESEAKLRTLPDTPENTATKKTLLENIGAENTAIKSIEHKTRILQNKVESNNVIGMAIQGLSTGVGGLISGSGQIGISVAEATVVGTEGAQEVAKDLYNKNLQILEEQKERMNDALKLMKDQTELESRLYGSVGLK